MVKIHPSVALGCKPCPEPGLALLNSLEAHSSQQMEGAGWDLLLQHFQHGNKSKDLEKKQPLSQWWDLGCRLMGVSLGDSSNLSSSHPSPPGSVLWVLTWGLAHKSFVFKSVRGIFVLFALPEPRQT